MIRISQLKLPIDHTEQDLKQKILGILRIKESVLLRYSIRKQSKDARRKPDIYYVYTVDVFVNEEKALRKKLNNSQVAFCREEEPYTCPAEGTQKMYSRPVVIGTGPAGLFCGYQLALMGYRPILLERGGPVDERIRDVERFWETGTLNPDSNVQFGEGGAGTFSDGKLNTLVKDTRHRNAMVLETFVKHGAPQEILYQNKPHIGTDILAGVVKNMRRSIEEAGGEVRFHARAADVRLTEKGTRRKLRAVMVTDTRTKETYELPADLAVLAVGHSARDTFQMLRKHGIHMEAKAFAVGVRMEHPQAMIDENQYGGEHAGLLSPADYKLTANLTNGRGVYTFCMCPGGYVVNASTEQNRLAVNGMSYHQRDGSNANSAVIVTVTPEDYGGSGPLAGVEFQRRLEEAAYREGKGDVPVQRFEDFLKNQPSKGPGEVLPQIKGAYRWSNVREIFPEYIAECMVEGIRTFGQKLKGYSRGDAIVSGVESRTSSPVRILRGDTMEGEVEGIYPCGEGAGYAGGITSAAMDGLKTAEAVAKIYHPFDN